MEKRYVFLFAVLVLILSGLIGYLYSKNVEMSRVEHSYNSDGWKYFYNDVPERALVEFEGYRKKDAKNYFALTGSGWSHYSLAQYDIATDYFKRAASLDMPDGFALRGLGRSYYQQYLQSAQTQPDETLFLKAKETLEEAIVKEKSADAYTMLGRLHLARAGALKEENDYLAAENQFRQAIALEPANAQIYNLAASTLYIRSITFPQAQLDLDEAKALLEQSIEKRPTANAYAGLGNVEGRLGNFEAAKKWHEQSLLFEENLEASHGLGLILLTQKRYPEAIVYFENELKDYPDNLRVLRALGISLRESGKLNEAKAVFEKTIALDDEYVHGYLNLMYIHSKQKNRAVAQQMLEKALSVESDLSKVNDQPLIMDCLAGLKGTYQLDSVVGCYDSV